MRFFTDWNVSTKLLLINLCIFLIIVGVITVVAFSFNNIERQITAMLKQEFHGVITNAQVGRDLTRVFAQTTQLIDTLLEQEEVVTTEGESPVKTLDAMLGQTIDPQLKPPLQEYRQQLQELLEQGTVVRATFQELTTADTTLNTQFERLANLIEETLVIAMVEGKSTYDLEQLQLTLPLYRETVLRVRMLLERVAQNYLQVNLQNIEDHQDARQALSLLDDLDVRLQALTKSEADVVAFGQQMIETARMYRTTMTRFYQELARLQQHLQAIDHDQQQALTAMQAIDTQVVQTTEDVQRRMMSIMTSSRLIVMILAGVIVVVMVIGWVSTRWVLKPLAHIAQVANQLSAGNLIQNIQKVRSKDEIGTVLIAMRGMVQQLREVVGNVKESANYVASGSQAMSSTASEMSQGATTQAAAAEEVSSSMEQMAANIRQNTDNALQTEKIAIAVAEDAQRSGQAVAEAVRSMQEIAQKIALIQDITSQTRMLSLNATIEAARAQESGRGFAVVASEVRALSERIQHVTTEITQLANSSMGIVENAGDMLAKLVPDIQKTTQLVQEISAASREQASGADQINRALQQLDRVTQQNSATSEELAATAQELAAQAEHLQQTMAFFTVEEMEPEPPEQELPQKPDGDLHTEALREKIGDDRDVEFERY